MPKLVILHKLHLSCAFTEQLVWGRHKTNSCGLHNTKAKSVYTQDLVVVAAFVRTKHDGVWRFVEEFGLKYHTAPQQVRLFGSKTTS